MMKSFYDLTKEELSFFKKLSTPHKIQDFLESLPMNFDYTYASPRKVLKDNRACCIEGAMVAALALWVNGQPPLLMDLKAIKPDVDHVVTLFKKNGYWGALSKTNHPVLRYRDPIYKTIRELVLSYFNEYYLEDGRKTLRTYSNPFDLSKYVYLKKLDPYFDQETWMTCEENLDCIAIALDESPHTEILTRPMKLSLRKVEKIEIESSNMAQWQKSE